MKLSHSFTLRLQKFKLKRIVNFFNLFFHHALLLFRLTNFSHQALKRNFSEYSDFIGKWGTMSIETK